jgi:arylsulfatase A-like enzyme
MTTNLLNMIKLATFNLFFLACIMLFAQSPKLDNPNILIILTDDQGSIDVNCYGAKDLYTPNMDRLAAQGTRFTQFYAAASVCSPSRAALLTGKTNLRAGLQGNVPVPGMQNSAGTMACPPIR